MNLSVSGSGELAWKGAAAALDVAVSGSGELGRPRARPVAVEGSRRSPARAEMKLAGKGESLKVAVSGSGEVDAKDFAVKDASVSIAGSGDVDLRLAGRDAERPDRRVGGRDLVGRGEGRGGRRPPGPGRSGSAEARSARCGSSPEASDQARAMAGRVVGEAGLPGRPHHDDPALSAHAGAQDADALGGGLGGARVPAPTRSATRRARVIRMIGSPCPVAETAASRSSA